MSVQDIPMLLAGSQVAHLARVAVHIEQLLASLPGIIDSVLVPTGPKAAAA
jgi:hypothetical protein